VFSVNRKPARSELCKFGLTVLIGLGIIGGLLWWRLGPADVGQLGLTGGRIAAIVLWIVGVLVGLVSLAAPRLGRYVYVGWMTGAAAIGLVVTPILFTILFIVVLPVFSLIRLGDPLRLRKSKRKTYWEDPKPHQPTLERMMRPF
jgi:hypothetical protein